MCNYCKSVKSEYPVKFLIDETYKITGLHVTLEGSLFIDTDGRGKPRLYLGLTDDHDELMQGSIEIKYCPICGEKLEA